MSPRRLAVHFRAVLVIATVIAGTLLMASPRAGQDPDQLPDRMGSGKPALPQTPGTPSIKMPTIGTPPVTVPTVVGGQQPTAPVQAPPRPGPMAIARLEAIAQAQRLGLNYLPGEVVVKFKDDMTPVDQTRAMQVLGAQPTADSIEWVGQVAIVRDSTQPNAYILADQMKGQPEVEYAEPNFIYSVDPFERATSVSAPPSPRVSSLRSTRGGGSIAGTPSDADYGAYQWNFNLINMPGAWDLQPGGTADIIVAVIDTGISGGAGTLTYPIWTGSIFQTVAMPYAANPDLPASRHVLPRDYIGSLVGAPLVDLDGHATHVSGTIGETTNNGLLVSGMAYNVRIMPIKVCTQYWDSMIGRGLAGIPGFSTTTSSCANADIADAIRYAVDNGARVMNISLGGTSASTTLQNALIYAAGKGAFIALSMGNEGDSGNPTTYPASYAASIDGVMSVSAVGWNSALAFYSSFGPNVEIAAPGGDSKSGAGRTDLGRIWQSTLRGDTLSGVIPRFDVYDKQGYQGTSMASPHVAGLAALILSQMPSLTGAQVEKIIRATAKDIGTAGRDNSFGYGLIQPRAALFGYGIGR